MVWTDFLFVVIPLALGILFPMLMRWTSKASKAGRGIRCGERPRWQPPSWVFSVVWPVLYLLIGLEGLRVWRSNGRRWSTSLTYWVVLTTSLILWWPVFSHWMCWPKAAFVSIVLIAGLVWYYTITRRAWLLAPLALWMAFASVLAAQAIPRS